jgi:hypothetical protein
VYERLYGFRMYFLVHRGLAGINLTIYMLFEYSHLVRCLAPSSRHMPIVVPQICTITRSLQIIITIALHVSPSALYVTVT